MSENKQEVMQKMRMDLFQSAFPQSVVQAYSWEPVVQRIANLYFSGELDLDDLWKNLALGLLERVRVLDKALSKIADNRLAPIVIKVDEEKFLQIKANLTGIVLGDYSIKVLADT